MPVFLAHGSRQGPAKFQQLWVSSVLITLARLII